MTINYERDLSLCRLLLNANCLLYTFCFVSRFVFLQKKSLVGIGPAAGNDDLRCASYGANDVLETAIKAPGQRPSVFPLIEAE